MIKAKHGVALDLSQSRIVIAGGASLVGVHTAEHLLAAGVREVVLVDNFSVGSVESIAHLASEPRVRVVRADLTRLHELVAAFDGADGVINLAAYLIQGFAQNPWQAIDVNVRGVQNVLEGCRIARTKKFVLASSNAVYGYGPGLCGTLAEETPLHSAGAPPAAILYGTSKVMGEQFCRQYYETHGLDYLALRYSTVYGERQHARAAARFIIEAYDSLRRGEPPVLTALEHETKHFVHVADVARANVAALRNPATDAAVNISGPEPVTIGEVLRLVQDYCGTALAPEFGKPRPGAVRLTSGDAFTIPNGAAESIMGWRPQVSVPEGIRRLLAWHEAQVSRNGSPPPS